MVINVFGRRGSGKTTLIRGNLRDMRWPVLIVDVLGNYNIPCAPNSNIPIFQTDELADTILKVKSWKDKKKPDEKLIINLTTPDPELAADYLSSVIWEINGGTLVLDEIDSISIKEGSCFDQYIRYGRNHFGDLITGCRRPAELARGVTAAANKIFAFQTHEMRDIEYFYSIYGERADELMKIERFTGLWIDYDTNETGTYAMDINGLIRFTKREPLT